MTRDEAIQRLSKYKENEELIVLWYDKDFFDGSTEKDITEDQWQAVIDKFDGDQFEFVLELLMDKIEEVALETMEDN